MIYMMTPHNQSSSKKTNSKHHHKRKKQVERRLPWKVMISILLVILLMLTAWIQEKVTFGKTVNQDAMDDFALLFEWGDRLLTEGALHSEWSFRWDITLLNGNMEALADTLFLTERGELLPKTIRQNGEVVHGSWKLPKSELRLVRTEQERIAERVTITLQVDGAAVEKASLLKQHVKELHLLFQEIDANVQMNIKVYGETNYKRAINDIKSLATAQVIEEYDDMGTQSVTLFSNRIKQYRWLNQDYMANIQVAVHTDSNHGTTLLTIGVPLISGEFGEVISDSDLHNN